MNLLFDQNQNTDIDTNGSEELAPASNPHWFAGTGNEIVRGGSNIGIHAERTVGQMDDSAATALGFNQYLTRDNTVAKIHDIEPTAPEDLPKYEKPDAANSGAAAIFLGDLVQQSAALAASVVNPLVGFAAGASMGAGEGLQTAQEKGLTGEAATQFAGLQALEDGIGAALPGIGGIGERALIKYGSRFAVGGGVNVAQSEGFKWGRAEVLEAHGFHAQAEQMRQWDGQAAAAAFLLGGAFNLAGGHARDRDMPPAEIPPAPRTPETVPEATGGNPGGYYSAQPSPTPEVPAPATPLAGYKLSRADVKAEKSNVANAQRHLDRLAAEEVAIREAAPTSSGGANRRYFEQNREALDAIEAQRMETQERFNTASDRLTSHEAYGRQRIEAIHSDAAMHATIHDNYVTESAPGLATSPAADAAHVRSMDSAINSIHTGRPVDVGEHFTGEPEFLMRPDVADGINERQALAADGLAKADDISAAMRQQTIPDAPAKPLAPGVISAEIAQPFDALRQQVDALRETHPELADAMAPHVDAIELAHRDESMTAQQYEVAAACAIVHGA